MILPQTRLKAADNSGARRLICIRVLGRRRASLGTTIIAVVTESFPNGSVRRSEIIRAVVVRIRRNKRRDNGSSIRFDENAVVLLGTESNIRGSRIFGPVARELRVCGFSKIAALSYEVL